MHGLEVPQREHQESDGHALAVQTLTPPSLLFGSYTRSRWLQQQQHVLSLPVARA